MGLLDGRSARGEGRAMVEIALVGGASASDEGARPVTRGDVAREDRAGPIGALSDGTDSTVAVGVERAPRGIGSQESREVSRDRPVAREITRPVVEPQEG